MKVNIGPQERAFAERHIGPHDDQISQMLEYIKADSIDQLINQTIPENIQSDKELDIPSAMTEEEFLAYFRGVMSKNEVYKNFIGMGYYGSITPKVILRNILENPGWYTAYTPYQAEIAQGRLEALINFQTMVIELTGMEVANASLLDEGTAAAEAITMLYGKKARSKNDANVFFIDKNVFPQTLDVVVTRASAVGIEIVIGDIDLIDLTNEHIYGVMVQYPDSNGQINDHSSFVESAHEQDISVVFIADLMSLMLLKSPGSMGADVVVGTTQRFGIPMGFGGPHAAYFATKDAFKRVLPGRIIGVSKDAHGNMAYRMALQTREQHIKREKATSNICTAQVLLAVMAGMYGVYHGKKGLTRIAQRIAAIAQTIDNILSGMGFTQVNKAYFDSLKVGVGDTVKFRLIAESKRVNFRYFDNDYVGISIDETTTFSDIQTILGIFKEYSGVSESDDNWTNVGYNVTLSIPDNLLRTDDFLDHDVFKKYHCEHEMLRYLKKLENKDLSLTHSMISLGSCTMKLNATTEMIPVTWPELGQMHPFVPVYQAEGYTIMFDHLKEWLSEITGFSAVSLQPNSGAQGEFAGLMVIKAYHDSRGDHHRNITLIPSSAHGTNPASAVMAGQKVIIVECDDKGNINIEDLRTKAQAYKDSLAALMVTYPSTHGVFEKGIKEICQIIHDNGGQVYMDGANMNAQVGLTSPGLIGADVCHLNLHKTFCIPHGGGGPGMGPICVAQHLAPYLPSNPVIACGGQMPVPAISSAPYGSASILAISYAYIALMGGDGLKKATQIAILNANYIKERLKDHYEILYVGEKGRCAHEMIIDCREYKSYKIEVTDIAKRLMDYGYHAPTVSFPVAGTMMIEPTESETMDELDRFCDAMISIRNEIREIENGSYKVDDNVLVNAPHTAVVALSDNWNYSYSREKAVYPLAYTRSSKFWPSVSRIDNAYGDRNLVCACPPIEMYQESN